MILERLHMRVVGFSFLLAAKVHSLLVQNNPGASVFYLPPPPPKIPKSSVLRKNRKVPHFDGLSAHLPSSPPTKTLDAFVLADLRWVQQDTSYFKRFKDVKLLVLVDSPVRLTATASR
jgi:hypothetical protein